MGEDRGIVQHRLIAGVPDLTGRVSSGGFGAANAQRIGVVRGLLASTDITNSHARVALICVIPL
jgi:hypothetical protein